MSDGTSGPGIEDRPDTKVFATLARASHLVPGFWKGMWITVVLAAIGAVGRLVLPILLQRSINDGFRNGDGDGRVAVDIDVITRYCLIALVATVVAQLCTRVAAYRLGSWSEWFMAAIRRRCVDRFLDISLDQHARQKKGVLVARVTTDVESIARFFEWGAISSLINLLIVLAISVYLVITDLRLGLLAIVVASPVVLVIGLVQKHLLRAYDRVRLHVGTYLGRTGELVGGAAVIRAYGAEEVMRDGAVRAVHDRRRAQIRTGFLGALLFPMGELFATAAVSAVVLAAVALGPESGLAEGTVVAVVFAVIRLLDPVAEISENIDQTHLAVAGLARVLDVVDLPVELSAPPPEAAVRLAAGPLGVALDGVWYAYPARPDGSVEGLDPEGAESGGSIATAEPPPDGSDGWTLIDVSISAPAGTSVAVVGATGSGKSTVARLFVRLADPQRGRVTLGGVDVRDLADASLRRRVQLVPQEPFLFDGTILDNLHQARPGATEGQIASAAERLGLAEWVTSLPGGLATNVGERGTELSAGERQLVALLRAELVGPDVLVLDEATSSVDAATEARLAATIDELSRGRTLVVIAHRLSTAARAGRIVVMEQGRVVEQGTHAELAAGSGPYARMALEWAQGVSA